MFFAINYISCRDSYRQRFEELFRNRIGAIDSMPGFVKMKVLRPKNNDDTYLVISEWKTEENFKKWSKSAAFLEGHRKGFADLKKAEELGQEPPMKSEFKTYDLLTT